MLRKSLLTLCAVLSLSLSGMLAQAGDWTERLSAVMKDIEAPAKPEKPRKLLVYTHANGFVHSSIPVGAQYAELIGKKTGAFETTISNDPAAFDDLSKYDGILMMSTTGSFLLPKDMGKLAPEVQKEWKDKEVTRRKNIVDFLESGKGIAGIHAAADAYAGGWAEWGKIIGGYFNGHPWGKIHVNIDDPKSPVNAVWKGEEFDFSDEIYTYKAPWARENLHVLLSINIEKSNITKGENRADHDYGVAWISEYGKGRVFYTLFGHNEVTYANPNMQRFFLAGIQFALGDLKADATHGVIKKPEVVAKPVEPKPIEDKKPDEKKPEEKK